MCVTLPRERTIDDLHDRAAFAVNSFRQIGYERGADSQVVNYRATCISRCQSEYNISEDKDKTTEMQIDIHACVSHTYTRELKRRKTICLAKI